MAARLVGIIVRKIYISSITSKKSNIFLTFSLDWLVYKIVSSLELNLVWPPAQFIITPIKIYCLKSDACICRKNAGCHNQNGKASWVGVILKSNDRQDSSKAERQILYIYNTDTDFPLDMDYMLLEVVPRTKGTATEVMDTSSSSSSALAAGGGSIGIPTIPGEELIELFPLQDGVSFPSIFYSEDTGDFGTDAMTLVGHTETNNDTTGASSHTSHNHSSLGPMSFDYSTDEAGNVYNENGEVRKKSPCRTTSVSLKSLRTSPPASLPPDVSTFADEHALDFVHAPNSRIHQYRNYQYEIIQGIADEPITCTMYDTSLDPLDNSKPLPESAYGSSFSYPHLPQTISPVIFKKQSSSVSSSVGNTSVNGSTQRKVDEYSGDIAYLGQSCEPTLSLVEQLKKNPVFASKLLETKKGSYKCSHCAQYFSNLMLFAAHIDKFQLERRYRCTYDTCVWSVIGLPRLAEFKRHYYSQHSGTKIEVARSKEKKFQCQQSNCNKYFARKDSLLRHQKLVHDNINSRFNKRIRAGRPGRPGRD